MSDDITSYRTRSGSLVLVNPAAVAQVRSPNGTETVTGPTWHCHGCGDHSDEPLGNPAFVDPLGIVNAVAEAHAADCRT